ncbi:MerR family transcriptional regulator [Patescibacteria group bacterium]|nr:MerR family transcriptional regulator [Patescibacteria group bacterium]
MSEFDKYIKLTELVEVLNKEHNIRIKKPTLYYYNNCGLIEKDLEFGGMHFFDKEKVIKKIKLIKTMQRGGLSIREIQEKFNEIKYKIKNENNK